MKSLVLLVFLLFSISSNTTSQTELVLDLLSASKKNSIEYTITGNEESTHYLKPIKISISNITAHPISIHIPNGQLFETTSEDIQDVVITKEEMITLAPGQHQIFPLHAMCIQQSKSGSNTAETYLLGDMATGNLAKLTHEIERRLNFNTLGQYSVWAITDSDHLNNISGFDEEEALYLKTYVASLLNVPVPEYDPDDYLTNYNDTGLIKRSAQGKFKFRFSEESAVTIAMFDAQNIVVRELYNNPNEPAGEKILEFQFDVEVYCDQVYYVRLIQDGEIQINMKMKPRGS